MSRTLIFASCICESWSLLRASMEKFKGVLALICVAMKCNVLTWFFFFFFSFFRFACFCVYFLMVSKLTGRNSQVWSCFLARQSLKLGIVLFSIRNILQLQAEGKGRRKGEQVQKFYSRGRWPSAGAWQGFQIGLDTQTRKRSHLTFPLEIPMQIELIQEPFFTHTDTHAQF